MQKLLLRRTLRELKANALRYLALFALTALAMFVVIGVVGSAESVIHTVQTRAEANCMEDGQFGVLFPLRDAEEDALTDRGVTLEKSFHLDFSMEDGSALRLMKNREKINLVELESGTLARNDRELVLERIYATAHGYAVGDSLLLAGETYTVSGIGTSPDYDYCLRNMSDMSSDGRLFGTAFVTEDTYAELLDGGKSLRAEEYRYSYRLGEGVTDADVKEYLLTLPVSADIPQAALLPGNLTEFVKAADNPRIKASQDDLEINIRVGVAAGLIVLVLIAYVISVFVVHSIDRESAMIGALYALGVSRKQLMLHYTMLPVLLCLIGGVVGTLAGYSEPGIAMMASETYSYYSIPQVVPAYSPYLLAYGLLLPPLVAFVANRTVIRARLGRSALSLLRKTPRQKRASRLRLRGLGFVRAFQVRQFLREKRSCATVLAGMFVSMLVLILGLNCYALCYNIQNQNREDARFASMYVYKYPVQSVPEESYPAVVKALKKEVLGYDMEISVVGLTADNPFFPAITSHAEDEISLSSSVAGKYGLSVGDSMTLRDNVNDREYLFTVKEIVPYSIGLNGFMDIESMRTRFDMAEGSINAVFADHTLDISPDQLRVVSYREDILRSADIFMEIMAPLMTMMTVCSAIIFLIVLYQMMKVMVDRSSFSISLMRIFGYRDGEIRRLYLDSSFVLIALGALALIPLAKAILDVVYPRFVANVACGIDLSWPPVLYGVVYAGILFCYLLTRTLLMRRLRKVSPAVALKDRE